MKSETPEPIYRTLKQSIVEKIVTKQLSPGDKLPSLREMAKQLDVSLAPVRQAIQELDAEGYIVRYRGSGIFVSPDVPHVVPAGVQELAFVIPGIDANEMFARMARAMQACCVESGYRATVLSTEDYQDVADLLDKLPEMELAGAVIFPPADKPTADALLRLRALGFPFALVNPNHLSLSLPCVTGNDFIAGYTATKHLVDLGHQRIALVGLGQGKELEIENAHYRGYRKAFSETGMVVDDALIVVRDTILHRPAKLIEWGERIGEKLFAQNPDTTAMIAPPAVAAGLARAVTARGMNIPADVSMVCIGTALNYLVSSNATAVDFHEELIVAKAMETVAQEIETGRQDSAHVQLPCDLVVGETTGLCRKHEDLTTESTEYTEKEESQVSTDEES